MLLYISCLGLLLVRVQSSHLISLPGDSQFHAQDVLGQYSYGYSGGPSAKIESRTADGITRGGYSYIDANGILQSVNYISDPINGFRVAATNLPQAPLAEAVKEVDAIPSLKLPEGDVKTRPEVIPALRFGAIENPLPPVQITAGDLNLSPLPTLKLTPDGQKLTPVSLTNLTPDALAAAPLPTLKLTPEELKFTSVNTVIPDVRPSIISAAPALKLTPLTVPAFNLSPLALTYQDYFITPQLPYAGYSLVLQPDYVKLQEELAKKVKEEEKKVESANQERSKRDVYYSPAVLAILRSRTQHLVQDKYGNFVYASAQPLADVKPLGSPGFIY